METEEINEKLRPIAENAKAINFAYRQIIKRLEKEAMKILNMDTEFNTDGTIEIKIYNHGTIQFVHKASGSCLYYYPLIHGYKEPKSIKTKEKYYQFDYSKIHRPKKGEYYKGGPRKRKFNKGGKNE